MEIKTYNQIEDKIKVLEEIRYIFFESSSVKSFKDETHKENFFNRWCGDYLNYYPEFFYLAFSDGKLLGYLSGVIDTTSSLKVLNVPAQHLFSDLHSDYPAHLHINFHPDARGKGLGTKLVDHFEGVLKQLHVKGVHLVTSRSSRNVSFYERAGYDQNVERDVNGSMLFFMGKRLT